MDKPSISVVVPTYNAERELKNLLYKLSSQRVQADEILIVDSSSSDNTVRIASEYPSVRIEVIKQSDFNHGGTRNSALLKTSGEFVLFLTQDAIPIDSFYIENLLIPFEDEQVAMSYGRQVPKEGAPRFIQLVQEYNYPSESCVRDRSSVDSIGIKAYFCSDSCSAYRRAALEKIGGVPHPCSTNEDMLAAARFLKAGYKVAYSSSAKVYHSHNFSFIEQYKRNKAVGMFLEVHKSELGISSEIGEGSKLVRFVLEHLNQEKEYAQLVAFLIDCAARFLGNRVGRSKINKNTLGSINQ